ncbi:hypothetical protein [uncultured Brevibacillus sp.]|uniref:hypothetical protein n=1 Tax=uncultured Brevibacillus sp. TaxID=169970 RepID=UPI0025926543|nr:hypothetical protein [uncultured Brevibacillus sp.]
MKYKRFKLALLLLVGALPFFISEYLVSYSHPIDALMNSSLKQTDELYQVKQVIGSSKRNDEVIFFYLNNDESITAAVVTKGLFGWKSGLQVTASSRKISDLETDQFTTSHITVSNRVKFGLIASTDITDIRVDEEQATILPLDFDVSSSSPEKTIKLWYAISDHFSQNSKLEFLNAQGEMLKDAAIREVRGN